MLYITEANKKSFLGGTNQSRLSDLYWYAAYCQQKNYL